MNELVKHPWERKSISVDWAGFLSAASTTISSSQWVDVHQATTVVLSSQTVSGTKTLAIVSGGADGDVAYIENRVTFADSTQEVFPILVKVVGQVA